MLLTIVIPTRNRSDLIVHALASVACSNDKRVEIIVSDNSTEATEVEKVKDACSRYPHVGYIRPAEPLPMSEHWEWILQHVRARGVSSHLAYLTDRMAFRADALKVLISAITDHSNSVISFTYDRIDDTRTPVVLQAIPRSGRLFDIDSQQLIAASARMSFGSWLPRMLNCAVPIAVLDAISARFGNVFRSVSPDYSFCYKCLATVATVKYLDKALLLNFGLSRSNGASVSRGLPSKDSVDFLRTIAAHEVNEFAPIPELMTVGNGVISEYNRVRAFLGDRFPALDMQSYLRMLAVEVAEFSAGERKVAASGTLKSAGWRPDWRFRAQRFRARIERRIAAMLGYRFATMNEAIDFGRRRSPREFPLLARIMGRYRHLASVPVDPDRPR